MKWKLVKCKVQSKRLVPANERMKKKKNLGRTQKSSSANDGCDKEISDNVGIKKNAR